MFILQLCRKISFTRDHRDSFETSSVSKAINFTDDSPTKPESANTRDLLSMLGEINLDTSMSDSHRFTLNKETKTDRFEEVSQGMFEKMLSIFCSPEKYAEPKSHLEFIIDDHNKLEI